MKDQTTIFKKPNLALVMIPRKGKLTAIGRKMYNVMLKKTHTKVMELKSVGKVVDAESMFEMPINEFFHLLSEGGEDKHYRKLVKDHLSEMQNVRMDWEAPDAETGVVWRSMGLLSEAQIEVREGVVWGRWMLPPSLLTAVSDPERFTVLDLDLLARLDSYCAVALYEICRKYKENPTHLTSRNSTDWWIDALTNMPGTVDKKTGLVVRRPWRRVKNETLNKAIEEINSKTDITVDLLEFKVGKAIKEAQFKVMSKTKNAVLATAAKMSPETALAATKLDLSLSDISGLISQGQSEAVLKVAFSKLEARFANKELTPVGARFAYLKTVLADMNQYVSDAPQKNTGVAAQVAAPIAETLSFKGRRRTEIKLELLGLPLDQQRIFADSAIAKMAAAGSATEAIKARVKAGSWNGTVLGKMVEAFAVAKYGADWGVEA